MPIIVRRASVQDVAAYARVMGDPGAYSGLVQMPDANEYLWRARMTEGSAPSKTAPPLVTELDCALVGSACLHPAGSSQRRSPAATLGISVLPKANDRGAGIALMAGLCGYADS